MDREKLLNLKIKRRRAILKFLFFKQAYSKFLSNYRIERLKSNKNCKTDINTFLQNEDCCLVFNSIYILLNWDETKEGFWYWYDLNNELVSLGRRREAKENRKIKDAYLSNTSKINKK